MAFLSSSELNILIQETSPHHFPHKFTHHQNNVNCKKFDRKRMKVLIWGRGGGGANLL